MTDYQIVKNAPMTDNMGMTEKFIVLEIINNKHAELGGGATLLGDEAGEFLNNITGEVIATGIFKSYAPFDYAGGSADELTLISFPQLEESLGGITFSGGGAGVLETISFESLVSAKGGNGEFSFTQCPALTTVNLPVLTTLTHGVAENFWGFTDNDVMTAISLPELAKIDSIGVIVTSTNLGITGNAILESISIPKLADTTGSPKLNINITTNPLLTSIDLGLVNGGDSITGYTSVIIQDNAVLTEITVPTAITGIGFAISLNPLLETVTVDNLTESVGATIEDCAVLTSISFASLVTATQGFGINDNAILTSISFPALVDGGSATYTGNALLTTISLPELTSFNLADLSVQDNAVLQNITIPKLATAEGVDIQLNNSLTAVSFPSLTDIADDFSIVNELLFTNFSAPLLANVVGDVNLDTLPEILTVALPLLASVGGTFKVDTCAKVTVVSIPLLDATTLNISDNVLLTTVTLLAGQTCVDIDFSGNAFPVQQVDDVLALYDVAGESNGTIDVSGGTNGIPSGAGLTSKANLEGKGWTVTVNS